MIIAIRETIAFKAFIISYITIFSSWEAKNKVDRTTSQTLITTTNYCNISLLHTEPDIATGLSVKSIWNGRFEAGND